MLMLAVALTTVAASVFMLSPSSRMSASACIGLLALASIAYIQFIRKKNPDSLVGSEIQQSIINASPYPIFRVNTARAVVNYNEAFRQWFIRDSFPVRGRHLIDVIGISAWNTLRNALEQAHTVGSATTPLTIDDIRGVRRVAQVTLTVDLSNSQHTADTSFVCAILPTSIRSDADTSKNTDSDLIIQRYLSEVETSRQHLREQAETLRQVSLELTAARDQALSATLAKSAFLANMSHELRTPLNGIVTMAHLLCEESLSPSQAEYADIIRTSSDALLAIINDILDFSKIEADKLTISPQPFMLRESLSKLLALLKPQMSARNILLVVHIDDNVPDALIGDDGRLRQVFINLLGNAIKFTHEYGVIVVFIEASEVTSEHCVLRFAVSDSGIGIAEDKVDKIFGAFDQEDASTTRNYGGTGLGLSISRRLVDLMGGTISVVSKKGVGSSFRFTLRLPIQSPAEQAAQLRKQRNPQSGTTIALGGGGLRVLVAEDNLVNQKVAARLLSVLGHHAHIVSNGAEALRAWQEGTFDLILMDCHMPELDGYAATRAIRTQEQSSGAHIPIIGLTAATMKQELDRCIEVGMDDHLTKPVPKSLLQEKLDTVRRQCAEVRNAT